MGRGASAPGLLLLLLLLLLSVLLALTMATAGHAHPTMVRSNPSLSLLTPVALVVAHIATAQATPTLRACSSESHKCTAHDCACPPPSVRVAHHHGGSAHAGILCHSCETGGQGTDADNASTAVAFEGGFRCQLRPKVLLGSTSVKGQTRRRFHLTLGCERPASWQPAHGVPGNPRQQRPVHVLDVPRPYVLLFTNRIQGPLGAVHVSKPRPQGAGTVALTIDVTWTIPAQHVQPGDEVRARVYDYNTHYHFIDR